MPYRVDLPPYVIITLLLWRAVRLRPDYRPRLVSARQRTQNPEILVSSEYYIIVKTFNNGSLGSGIDEERSEMR
jgi:hypothetical protein